MVIATCIAIVVPMRAAAEPAPPDVATPPEATPPVTTPELPPSEVVPATPVEPVEPPPPEPTPAPTIQAAPFEPAFQLPPRPRYDGRRLLAATYALTGIAWSFQLAGLGIALAKCSSNACVDSHTKGFLAFYGMGATVQIAALITGGLGAQRKGIYDAWRYAASGRPRRNAVAFMAIGGVLALGSLGGMLGLVLGARNSCFDRCNDAELAGYVLGEQALATGVTLGGSLFDYGRGYRRANRHYAGLTLAPWSPRGRGGGAALAGRF